MGLGRQKINLVYLILGALAAVLIGAYLAGCASILPGSRSTEKPKPPKATTRLPAETPARKSYPLSGQSYTLKGQRYWILASAQSYVEKGVASWYGRKFHGKKTASGERYNMYDMTAAHKTLPLGTWVKVTNLSNFQDVTVKINDRGPFVKGRIIDLSYIAARLVGLVGKGTAWVRVEALGVPE
ncbi:MAG: septal ring lytic transglycosylase RlpA family protein, partial [Deltaproteobacteria bacterium]|nr:septal ring lytic transglycosylase RlpA family protein [Deltaproteobacteria bacterium]